METLDDQLRRVLATQVEDVDPQLRGADLRALAASRRSRTGRSYGQLAAAAAVLVIAVLPFVLRHHSPTVTRPGGPGTVSTTTPNPGSQTPSPPSLSPRPSAPRPTTTTEAGSTSTPSMDVPSAGTPVSPPTPIPSPTSAP